MENILSKFEQAKINFQKSLEIKDQNMSNYVNDSN